MIPPMMHTGQKTYLRKFVLANMPKHHIYVEPWAGAASILYAKEPSELEIINDLDPYINKFFLTLQTASDSDCAALQKMDWSPSKDVFYQHKESLKNGVNGLPFLQSFIYVNLYSYSGGGIWDGGGFTPTHTKALLNRVARILESAERIQKVRVLCQDAIDVIKTYDSPDTFFYLDPPYPDTVKSFTVKLFSYNNTILHDYAIIGDALNNLKGKFIMSIDDTNSARQVFSSFPYCRMIQLMRSQSNKGLSNNRTEIVVANFHPPDDAARTKMFSFIDHWKIEGHNRFPPSAYLYKPDIENPKSWKIRIESYPGKVTAEQLLVALEEIKDSDEIPQEDRENMVQDITGRLKSMGMSTDGLLTI